ncbi:ATP-dependent DNA ligase [Streptomyces fuscigenes]|nr:ATP-dependent DNA ligase [Streptomyces fuscigenes]
MLYQPKLDGFRVIVFVRDGAVYLQSRRGADLTGAFVDVAAGGVQFAGEDVVLDGELVVLGPEGRLDFGALQQRARRRGRTTTAAAVAHPAHVVVFDVLEHRGRSLLGRLQAERWELLVELFARRALRAPWTLISCTHDREQAAGWLEPVYASVGIEGVMIKTVGGVYRPGERTGAWSKVRAYDTTEALVAGVTGRPSAPTTLLLGRHGPGGRLCLVARTTPLAATDRALLGALLTPAGPGHPWQDVRFSASWGSREPLEFTPVEPEHAVEFRTDSAVDPARGGGPGRHRHPVRFLRLRTDMDPETL